MLRGVALLGILLMNVQAFSMPYAAYMNPTAWGRLEGIDLAAWLFAHLATDQKMMAIFSMLFGAGIVLFSERAEARGESPWRLHLRRNVWLLCFGLAHAYLLWYGDILFLYGICALALYPCRHLRPSRLFALGLASLALASLLFLYLGGALTQWPEAQRLALESAWQPSPERLAAEVERYRGGWLEQLPHRAALAFEAQTSTLVSWGFWRAGGMMLIGMALYRLGVLTGRADASVYWSLLGAALLLGLPLVGYGVYWNFANDWGPRSLFLGSQFNYWGSLPVSLGWVGAVMLLLRRGRPTGLRHRLAALGRMAFSQYLLQSVLCSLIFYGHGLGWFGGVERSEQLLIVVAIWFVQLWSAPLWLRHFRFGPLEWLWRSLTYRRRQPFLR